MQEFFFCRCCEWCEEKKKKQKEEEEGKKKTLNITKQKIYFKS